MGFYMNKSNVRILLIIPAALFATMIVSFLIASILESPTDRGAAYSFFLVLSLAIFLLAPLPCIVLSVIGTLFVSRLRKQKSAEHNALFVLGTIDIALSIIVMFLALAMFVGGQGV